LDLTFTGNTGNGARFNLVADADIDLTLTGSDLSGNTLSGLQTTTNADVTDSPTIVMDVEQNTFNNNGQDGINILTPHLANIDNNTISGNGRDGINIGVGSFSLAPDTITDNLISGNVDDGIDVSASFILANIESNTIRDSGDDGLAFTSNSNGGAQIIAVNDNLVQNNAGDGIQISASQGSGSGLFSNSYSIDGNTIVSSGARGINVVNGGGTNALAGNTPTRTSVSITNNIIRLSGLEGIYVINTASNTQGNETNVDNLASAALLADGNPFARPLLNLTVDGNLLDSNGQTATAGNFIGATGIVIRVGTSDASDDFTDDGGFASGGRGGVVAAVTNNVFTGEFGADATFHPFTSTIDPATTTGTWTDQNENPRNDGNNVFVVNPGYQSDPLARLDLTFTGNTGDGLFATNPLAATAVYSNDEPEFKSRGITGVSSDTTADGAPNFPAIPDDNGPFTTGARLRNAARQADRAGLPPTIADGSTFLYPGLGASTFRVHDGGGNFFTNIVTDFGDAVPIGNPANGELPFVWGTF
jgi:hypothetical protein